jgi:hypothetical protein
MAEIEDQGSAFKEDLPKFHWFGSSTRTRARPGHRPGLVILGSGGARGRIWAKSSPVAAALSWLPIAAP